MKLVVSSLSTMGEKKLVNDINIQSGCPLAFQSPFMSASGKKIQVSEEALNHVKLEKITILLEKMLVCGGTLKVLNEVTPLRWWEVSCGSDRWRVTNMAASIQSLVVISLLNVLFVFTSLI